MTAACVSLARMYMLPAFFSCLQRPDNKACPKDSRVVLPVHVLHLIFALDLHAHTDNSCNICILVYIYMYKHMYVYSINAMYVSICFAQLLWLHVYMFVVIYSMCIHNII